MPLELRIEIYKNVLPTGMNLIIEGPRASHNGQGLFFRPYIPKEDDKGYRGHLLALLSVNRQIHEEAGDVLYRKNNFSCVMGDEKRVFCVGWYYSPFNTVRALPQSAIGKITSFTLFICVETYGGLPRYEATKPKVLEWLDELSSLLKDGESLRSICIQVRLSDGYQALGVYDDILKPLKVLDGLQEAKVEGDITKEVGIRFQETVTRRKSQI